MTRFAAGVSITGLAVMTGAAVILGRTAAFSLETRVTLHLVGLALFILGGAAGDVVIFRHRRR